MAAPDTSLFTASYDAPSQTVKVALTSATRPDGATAWTARCKVKSPSGNWQQGVGSVGVFTPPASVSLASFASGNYHVEIAWISGVSTVGDYAVLVA